MTRTSWLSLFSIHALCCWGCDQASPNAVDASTEADAGSGPSSCEGSDTWDSIAIVDQLYPLVDGARWVYRHSGGSESWDEEVTLTAQRYAGRDAFLLADTAGPSGTRSDSILTAGSDAVCRVHKEVFAGSRLQATTDYVPGFTRFDRRWLAWADGRTEAVTYRRTELDPQGVMVRDGERTHEFTVEAHEETVSVPAGEFEGCLRVFRDRIRDTDTADAEDEDKYFWFCPGVGKVREEDATGAKIEELVECEIPGGACE
jgi:hypothetical protein